MFVSACLCLRLRGALGITTSHHILSFGESSCLPPVQGCRRKRACQQSATSGTCLPQVCLHDILMIILQLQQVRRPCIWRRCSSCLTGLHKTWSTAGDVMQRDSPGRFFFRGKTEFWVRPAEAVASKYLEHQLREAPLAPRHLRHSPPIAETSIALITIS